MQTEKYIDEIHKITDDLERKISQKVNIEVLKQEAYKQGYEQACEDFAKYMRCVLPAWLREAAEGGNHE